MPEDASTGFGRLAVDATTLFFTDAGNGRSIEPQLAALAVLETTANVAILALAVEYPELASGDANLHDPPELGVAIDLTELARAVDVTSRPDA